MYLPVYAGGRMRLINTDGDGERDLFMAREEAARQYGVARRRMYFRGEQYDAENWEAAKECGLDPWKDRLPEHERRHAYSTQIAESVRFIADQLSDGFRLTCSDSDLQALVDDVAAGTEQLNGGDEDEDLTTTEVLVEALVAMDVPVEVLWNPVTGVPELQFWDSEQVRIDNPYGTHVESVTRTEMVFVDDPAPGVPGKRQVTERVVYAMHVNERGVEECRRDTYWDEEEEPRETRWLGLPIIPWCVLKANKEGLRGVRGDSIITSQCMETADRYNANEQHSYLIARYNSHGNVVVVGDAVILSDKNGEAVVDKDVADALKFPGGTQVHAVTLPTDPAMIEHQRKVCSDSIYASFGLTRVEPDTLSSLGGVSGYALEILNRKSEGTFRRIRRNWRKSWIALVNLIADVTAYSGAPLSVFDVELQTAVDPDLLADIGIDFDDPESVIPPGLVPVVLFENVDPLQVYPDRDIEVEMASGYIVDQVQIRDDYTAKLISRRQALKERGYDEKEIAAIEDEFEQAAPETGTFGGLTVLPGQSTQAPGQDSTARA